MTTATLPQLVSLRDFQRDALDAVHAAWARGVTRQIVHAPTGAGKTIMFAHLIRELGMAAVVLVHRTELVNQSVHKIRMVDPLAHVGVVQAERDQLGAPITVASVQTLAQPRRLHRLLSTLPSQRLIISDEAHHDGAKGRAETIDALAPTLLCGFTATPNRADGVGLGKVYQEVVYSISMIELMARGRLAPLRGLRIETETELDAVHTRDGDFAEGELADAINNPARNRLIVETWREHAAGRTRTVIFCVDVAHTTAVRDAFRAAGIDAELVTGESPDRARILSDFSDARFPVLVNCMVLTEGYDEPGIDCIIMARPTKSQPLYTQCVGRGARTVEGKEDCLVIDLVDNTLRHTLITLPNLAETALAGGADEAAPKDRRRDGEAIDLLQFAMGQQKLREKLAQEVNLFGGSNFMWGVAEANTHYAAAGRGAWIVLRPVAPGSYLPYLLNQEPGNAYQTRKLFDRPLDLGLAMGVAEDAARPYVERSPFVRRDAAWRTGQAPATAQQIAFARKLRLPLTGTETKADVSAMIDRKMAANAIRRARFD